METLLEEDHTDGCGTVFVENHWMTAEGKGASFECSMEASKGQPTRLGHLRHKEGHPSARPHLWKVGLNCRIATKKCIRPAGVC